MAKDTVWLELARWDKIIILTWPLELICERGLAYTFFPPLTPVSCFYQIRTGLS